MEVRVENTNERIDKYLVNILNLSRETITKMIKDNLVLVNNKETKPSYKVRENDLISIEEMEKKEIALEATKMDLDIRYEDEYLMVINKPSGLVAHPGNGNHNNTLVNGLIYYTKNLSKMEEFRPGIVHRLDKDTSGLMIVAIDGMSIPLNEFAERMESLGKEKNLVIRCMHQDIFNSMHKI